MHYQYRQIKNQILIEWLRANYPVGSYIINAKLGMPKSLYFPHNKYGKPKGFLFNSEAVADAVVFLPNEIHIVKLSINPRSRVLERLMKCERVFKKTHRYKDWWHLPISKILLVKDLNPLLINKAQNLGINLYIF